MDDCNSCICDPKTGESACTKMACPDGIQFKTDCQSIFKIFLTFYTLFNWSVIVNAGKCQKGIHYFDDCNSCVCNPKNGKSACTKKACPKGEKNEYYNIKSLPNLHFSLFMTIFFRFWLVELGKCSKGLTFMDECNTCICDPETGESSCTKMACPRSKYCLWPHIFFSLLN